MNVALHVASQLKAGVVWVNCTISMPGVARAACGFALKAGVVWVNCTNLFDASCGFGGYRESGYGREGGREGLLEYLEPAWFKNAPALPAAKPPCRTEIKR